MRRIIFLYFFMMELFLGIADVKAQIPFTQVNQVPLLLNPSLSGSKEKKRIAMGLNNYHFDILKHNSYYLSYDQMVKKIGSGVGGYVMHQSFQAPALDSETANMFSPAYSNKYSRSSSETSIGVMIAPKYRVGSQPKPKYTFSPSLMIGYSYGKQEQHHESNRTYGYYYSYYSPLHSYMQTLQLDSMQNTFSQVSTHLLRGGIGLELNSESLMVLYKATIDLENSKETDKILSISNNTEQKSVRTIHFKHRIYSLDQNLTIGKTFSLFNKKFSATPLIGLGIRSYLNVDQSSMKNRDPRFYYSKNLISKTNGVNYAHASLNFRAQKILFGVAATYAPNYGFFTGVSLGFQNSYLKVMSTWKIRSSQVSSELTVNVLF